MRLRTGKNTGFTLVENVIAIALVSMLCLSFIGAMILAGRMAGWSRDAMDAAELIETKLETVRSHSWGQILAMFPVPKPFYVTNGVVYSGLIEVNPVPASGLYQDELLEVTVSVSWQSGQRERSLRSQTYISPYGFSSDSL
ncbi:MAG: type II secretion system protein [Verrucomicrobia bacterium]|nr:type II secretion system protein [Verrucomicrobiota bacterium]